jgi:pyridinium-3,5-bisthiocarboxylic acid mononucleotide nickel chelatase
VKRVLMIDAPSGIAGDMFLAACTGLGFEPSELADAFGKAGITMQVAAEPVMSHGLAGLRLSAELPSEQDQPHRGLSDCLAILDRLELPTGARDRAGRMFERLAKVEARLHGCSVEEVHFHELGALDSIMDIAGAALAMERLGLDRIYLRDLALGRGTVNTAHGRLPTPAPATLALLEGLPLRESGVAGELVTPTGALILAECAEPAPPGLSWRPLKSAHGAGTRELPGRPNLLRLTLAEIEGEQSGLIQRVMPVIRCTVDDMSPEHCGYLMERLFAAGARDVHYRPLQMKKNRPGLEIEVLADEQDLERMTTLLFRETSTLGLRICREQRLELPREIRRVQTIHGEIAVKVATLPDGGRRAAPEYEDCARLARETGLPLAELEEAARAAWRELETGDSA